MTLPDASKTTLYSNSMIRRAFQVGAALAFTVGACTPTSASQDPVLANAGEPTHLAVDLSHVYVATKKADGTTINRVDKEDWQSEVVCTVPGEIEQLTLAMDNVYWLLDHKPGGQATVAIQKAEKAPGAKAEPLLTSQQRVTSFAIDATHLYWTQAGDPNDPDEARSPGILRAMDPSQTPTNVVTRLKGEPNRVTLGGGQVYWVTKEPDGSSAVMSWSKAGGDPVELLLLHPDEVQGKLPALAATDDGVYVLGHREVILLGPDGKRSQRVRHGFIADESSLLFDYHYLYFRTDDGLMRLKPDSSEFLPFAPVGKGEFAVGADYVYWFDGDKVVRKEK